jgi:hypothetical protein
MLNFAKPQIPAGLLHDITRLAVTTTRDIANGGQWRPTASTSVTFKGVVLPLSNADWKQLPEGSYTQNSQKLYTDDPVEIRPGQLILDTYDGQRYTVKTELAHNTLHPLRRFIVEGVIRT